MNSSPWRIASMALMILLLGVMLHTFGDYGMSWDEHYRQTEGAKKLVYYQNIFAGHYAPYQSQEDLYPGFFDLLHQGVNLISPLGLIPTGHLLSALFAWIGVWGAYQLARRLGGEKAAFFAALFTITFPHFYGHAFINPKDIPFAACFIWSLYYIIKIIDGPLDAKSLLKLGVCIGLTLGVRAGGVMLLAYLAGAFICRLWLLRHEKALGWEVAKYIGFSAGVAAWAFLVMLPFWPYAHPNPFGALFHTLGQVANFPWNGAVLFNGQIYAATDLPWYYLPEMLIVTTPELFLALTLVGLGFVGWKASGGMAKKGLHWFTPRRVKLAFLVATFIFPIAVICIRSATLYDGIRHFLFVLPIWAVLMALVVARISTLPKQATLTPDGRAAPKNTICPSWRLILRNTLFVVIGCHTAMICAEYIRLHPYQYAYYNHLVGGTQGAWGNFELEYWGTSHREAVEKLVAHLAKEGDTKVHTVTCSMAPWLVETYLPKNLVFTTDGAKAEFYISFTRFRADLWSDGTYMEDCFVARENAPFAIVKDRRKILEAAARSSRVAPRLVSGIMGLLPVF